MKAWTAPDLSVTITEEEANWAWFMFARFDWDLIESKLPAGQTDTAGNPVNRNNQNLRLMVMANCALAHRLGPEKSMPEAERLLDNPTFRIMVEKLLETFDTFADEFHPEPPC